jgi:formate dehydrogenase maturation protein FdhE
MHISAITCSKCGWYMKTAGQRKPLALETIAAAATTTLILPTG